ncbi:MAG: hypothetical protein F4057_00635 [Acidobacteria bacterium]|nr:hypothetical protein [Acidobacteriota bacterium]
MIAAAGAQAGPHEPSFRLFLTQGGDLIIRGDYVRVGDRVVFLLPLHEDEALRPSQLVTVPAAAVDWDTTGQYAAAVRAARYAAAGGPADFRRMSGEVAQALNAIAFTDDPQTRKALAQRTRQRLLDWTETNHGYRAQEVVEIVALLDEAVSVGTDAAGDLSVSLVATTARPQPLPVLPDPSLQEIIARALTAARLTPVPEERLAILHAAVATLDDPHSAVGAEWRAVTRAIAARDLDLERDRRRLQRTAAARTYHAGVKVVMDRFAASRAALDDIRLLAGTSVAVLASLERRLQDAADDLAGHAPPIEIRPSHDLLRQAFRLATGAARQRLQDVQNADPRAAWDSAAAAAGALMLFDRAAVLLDRSLPQTEPN